MHPRGVLLYSSHEECEGLGSSPGMGGVTRLATLASARGTLVSALFCFFALILAQIYYFVDGMSHRVSLRQRCRVAPAEQPRAALRKEQVEPRHVGRIVGHRHRPELPRLLAHLARPCSVRNNMW